MPPEWILVEISFRNKLCFDINETCHAAPPGIDPLSKKWEMGENYGYPCIMGWDGATIFMNCFYCGKTKFKERHEYTIRFSEITRTN